MSGKTDKPRTYTKEGDKSYYNSKLWDNLAKDKKK